jgi:MarR family transcriptional regulator, organic hydroperoxide resistance regulator
VSEITMTRQELDQLLFNSLTAIYAFERDKVKRFELSYGQIYLLQLLRRQSPSRMSEIAYRMGMPISTTTRLVAKMERMQLLERVADEKDRRAILVSLNKKGEKIVRTVEDHSFSVLSSNLKDFSEDELNAFIMTAQCLDRILGTQPKNVSENKCK